MIFWIQTFVVMIVALLLWKRRLGHPLVLFVGVWLTGFALNLWSPIYVLYEPSQETANLLGTSVVCFCLGFLITEKSRRRSEADAPRSREVTRDSLAMELASTSQGLLVHSAVVFGLVVLVGLFARQSIDLIASGEEAGSLRSGYFQEKLPFAGLGGGGFLASILYLAWNYLVYPLAYGSLLVAVVRCVRQNTWISVLILSVSISTMTAIDLVALARNQTLLTVVLVLLATTYGAGRTRSVWFSRGFWKLKSVLVVLVLACAAYAGIMSVYRSGPTRGPVWETLAYYSVYLAGPPTAFEFREDVLQTGEPFIYTVGGFLDIANLAIRTATGAWIEVLQRRLDLQGVFEIGPDSNFNALYTWCIYFYQDFGVGGVVVIPLLYGLFVGHLYRRVHDHEDLGGLAMFVFFYSVALYSIWEWRFAWGMWVAVGTTIFLLSRRRSGFLSAARSPAASRRAKSPEPPSPVSEPPAYLPAVRQRNP